MYSLNMALNKAFGFRELDRGIISVVAGSCMGKSTFIENSQGFSYAKNGLPVYGLGARQVGPNAFLFVDLDLFQLGHANHWYIYEIDAILGRLDYSEINAPKCFVDGFLHNNLKICTIGHTFHREPSKEDTLIALTSEAFEERKERWLARQDEELSDEYLKAIKQWQNRKYMLDELCFEFGCSGIHQEIGNMFVEDILPQLLLTAVGKKG